jgi:hypothetical protein
MIYFAVLYLVIAVIAFIALVTSGEPWLRATLPSLLWLPWCLLVGLVILAEAAR